MAADSLLAAMETCGLAGESWAAWRTVAKVLDAEALDADELALFERCTGRTRPPTEPPAEVFIIAGRRSGKTRFAGACAVRAATKRYVLAPGERAAVAIAAADRDQARVALDYATAPFRARDDLRGLVQPRTPWRALRDLVTRETRWGIDLASGVSIEVRTSHYGRVRGRTFALALADEVAFWQRDDGENPASEVLAAIRPGLTTLGGPLIAISTPYARTGALWDAFQHHYANDDPRVLVWKAPSRVMNPTLDERMILDALDRRERGARRMARRVPRRS